MANPKHVDILKQGIDAWTHWRKEHSNLRPDLSGLDLVGANLFRMDLSYSKLNHANLKKANLRETNLTGASLYRANLSEAIFTKAILIKANLQQTDLIGAKLDQTDLRRADLRRADLFGAYLPGADLRGTSLVSANLSSATITGARLYSSVRDDWKIDGIICNHIFWDAQCRQRIPLEGKFNSHQFETIYESLPSPAVHFTKSMGTQTTADKLLLKRNNSDGKLKSTPAVFSKPLLSYLNALAELQHLVNEFCGQSEAGVSIVSISQKKHVTVEITGAAPLLSLIRDSIVPWRRHYGQEVEKVNRTMTKASIINREAEILGIRSNTEKNPIEARMFEAEAAKMRAEAHLLNQKTNDFRHYIYKEIETALLKLIPTETMAKSQLAQFKRRAATPMQRLVESDLADYQ